MKKLLFSLLSILLFSGLAFAAGERYVVFFAETSDIPSGVAAKIMSSKRFCMTVPLVSGDQIPDNLDELVASGKIEPALVFNPEPLFPVMARVYKMSGSRNLRGGGFEDFITDNISGFQSVASRDNFGVFLKSGQVSSEILSYFAGAGISWVNAKNASETLPGVFLHNGIDTFVLYNNFPSSAKDVMPWLSARTEDVIPVLLTKKQLSSLAFMTYLVDLFEKSVYIKPAVPSYISFAAKDLVPARDSVAFGETKVNENILNKLYLAAEHINKYRSAHSQDDAYRNAQSELGYLCGYELLTGVAANITSSIRMFEASFNNVFRLLGFPIPDDNIAPSSDAAAASDASQIKQIAGGVSITNNGYIYGISVYNSGDSIRVDVSAGWGDNVEFVDLYIAMNDLDWAGSTSMLPGAPGFFTSDSGWEYAIRITQSKASLYRYSADGATLVTDIAVDGNSFVLPNRYLRGNPENWGYQAVSVAQGNITDFLNQTAKTKSAILSATPVQLSVIRIMK